MIHQTITCIADAYPEAEYVWSCEGGKWSINGSSLVGSEIGQFVCNCSAQNIIGETSRTSYWKGTITISKGTYYSAFSMIHVNRHHHHHW